MKTACLLTVFGLIAMSPAIAETQSKPYIDNRSDATELVRSFYNAIDRREFARAWSYFGDKKPAKDLAEFARSFEGASRVELTLGDITTKDGAEGSEYLVPASVVVRSSNAEKYRDFGKGKDPDERHLDGCIAVRATKPKSTDTSFTPMWIEQVDLKRTSGEYWERSNCGQTAEPAVLMRARVVKAFASAYASCPTLQADAGEDAGPEVHELTYREKFAKPEDPDKHATLYRFDCGSGAYNSNEIFYLAGEDGWFRQLQFTHPEYNVEYEDVEDAQKVKSITITGYQTDDSLANTEFSPETQALTYQFLWQGVGDAFTRGRYIFRDGNFMLVKYEIDAASNGEVDPITVIDLPTSP